MSQPFTIVYIIGAGCSACGGYPVAQDIPIRLKKFAERLSYPEVQELKRCVQKTVSLLDAREVDTLDALAQMHDPFHVDVKEAKIAMSAFFLSIEEEAARKAYANYAAFFEKLFSYGTCRSLREKAEQTPCRVLTYNYDRVFERAFVKWAKRQGPTSTEIAEDPHRFLNTGLRLTHEIRIDPNRFAFLKLHGGVGQFCRDNDSGMNYPNWPALDKPLPALNDNPYYEDPRQKTNQPMIVFPRDKKEWEQLHDADNKKWSFHGYLSVIWKAAEECCQQAKEIHIIGYSLPYIDLPFFKQLIQSAKDCERIVLRNRLAEKPRLEEAMESIQSECGAKWKIEYKAEDFFRITSET
jgi:hypothetical protein